MALNKIASEIRTLRISEENKSEDIKSKFNLTLYTSYLIEISKSKLVRNFMRLQMNF